MTHGQKMREPESSKGGGFSELPSNNKLIIFYCIGAFLALMLINALLVPMWGRGR